MTIRGIHQNYGRTILSPLLTVVLLIKIDGISGVKFFHNQFNMEIGRLELKVYVVGHKAVGMEGERVHKADIFEDG